MKEKREMKKLMVAAAAAALTGAVFAEAQVYTATLTVKTTLCKEGKFTKSVDKFLGKGSGYTVGEAVGYRQKATKKINGVFWGCDCNTIANPKWGYTKAKKDYAISGFAFWDATGKEGMLYPVYRMSFQWLLLNRVGQMNGVEGTWVLANKSVDTAFQFWGAGFGSPKGDWNCEAYINSINGNFAGWMIPNEMEGDGCVFCGENIDDCIVRSFCTCFNDTKWQKLAAAYGTWTIKYNASASKQMKKKYFITEATSLKWTSKMLKPVAEELELVRNGIKESGVAPDEITEKLPKGFTSLDNAKLETAVIYAAKKAKLASSYIVKEISPAALPDAVQQYLHAEGEGDDDDGDDDWDDDDDGDDDWDDDWDDDDDGDDDEGNW